MWIEDADGNFWNLEYAVALDAHLSDGGAASVRARFLNDPNWINLKFFTDHAEAKAMLKRLVSGLKLVTGFEAPRGLGMNK